MTDAGTSKKERDRLRHAAAYASRRDEILEKNRAWRVANPERAKASTRARYLRHRVKGLARKKEYQREKAPIIAAYNKAYSYKNRERIRERQKLSQRERREQPHHRIMTAMRSRVAAAVTKRYTSKAAKTENLIGCSVPHLIEHLESLFLPGMTWDNYGRGSGRWNIDHIKPCASFDLTVEANQRECFSWRNLQPLWFEDNIRKGAKTLNRPTK